MCEEVSQVWGEMDINPTLLVFQTITDLDYNSSDERSLTFSSYMIP